MAVTPSLGERYWQAAFTGMTQRSRAIDSTRRIFF